MIIKVKVHPNSNKQEIINKENKYEVYLKEKAENNKANLELIKLLSKYFNSKVSIKSGLKSRKKIIKVK